MPFPFFQQLHATDCGPTCLRMIAQYYGIDFHQHQMKGFCRIKKEGSSMLDLVDAAKALGIVARGLEITLKDFKHISLPVILHWDTSHFVVLFKITKSNYWIADPAWGVLKLKKTDFFKHLSADHEHYKTATVLTFKIL